MPIAQRTVDPTLVYQSHSITSHYVPIQNLSSTSLVALTSIIRQLSAISQYADEMFGEIFNEASKYVYRSSKLESRVQNLAQLVDQKRNDQIAEIPEMPTPAHEKPEQHILNVYIPRALKERYHLADPPPPLHLFAHLRIDGKDGPSMYTDPTLFFRAWLYNMNKEANNLRNPNKKRARRSRNSIRAGQVLYMGPTSASPPPLYGNKLALPPNPLYENRDQIGSQQEELIEDNIYEILPDSIDGISGQGREFNQEIRVPAPRQQITISDRADRDAVSFIGYQQSASPVQHHHTFQQDESFNNDALIKRDVLTPPAVDSERNPDPHQLHAWRDIFETSVPDPLSSSPCELNLSIAEQQLLAQTSNNGSFCLDDLPPPPDDMLLPAEDNDFYDVLPVRSSPMRNDPATNSPIRNEPAGHSPMRSEPIRHSPMRSDPVRHSPMRSEAVRHSPIRSENALNTQVDSGFVPTPPPIVAAQLSRTNSQAQPQNDLLAAIRAGINLRPAKRSFEESKPALKSANTTLLLSNDVASILQRRKYLIGDMCDDSNSSEEESDNVWSDEEDDSWN